VISEERVDGMDRISKIVLSIFFGYVALMFGLGLIFPAEFKCLTAPFVAPQNIETGCE
jgi:hypothetical protein